MDKTKILVWILGIIFLLLSSPSLALDDAARMSPDGGDMLMLLVSIAQPMGEQANFAALAESLRASGSDFDPLIAEIAEQTESELDVVALELAGALRQMRTQILKQEMDQLAARGLRESEDVARYREIMQLQDALRREAALEAAGRTV